MVFCLVFCYDKVFFELVKGICYGLVIMLIEFYKMNGLVVSLRWKRGLGFGVFL